MALLNGYSANMAGEGRIARGFRLLKQSGAFLRDRPRMLFLPLVSGIAVTVGAGLGGYAAIELDDGSGWTFAVLAIIGTFPLAALATFFNVAFLAMAEDAINGYEPSVDGGLRLAWERRRSILAWSLLSSLVGLLLAAVQQIPVVGGWVGRFLAVAGSIAWGFATFFVVPIIALHGTGAREAVKRSAGTIRERWGETATGDIAIGGFLMLLILPASVVGGIGVAAWDLGNVALGLPLVAVAVLTVAFAFTLSSALTSLFQLFLYRYVAFGTSDGPFAVADLERAVKPRRVPFWRRWMSG
jgi:hypothetical protein